MAYLGTPIDTTNQFQSLQGKRFNGDGSTTAFTLDIAPSSVFDIEVFVENVRQDPNSAYSISGTTLTFSAAPPSGTNNIYVIHQAKAVGTIDVPASGVVPASLASNIISGQTELAATPADTDEFLISDAGTIKRIDYSHIKSSNTPAFHMYATAQTTANNGAVTKIALGGSYIDTDSGVDTSNSKFTVPSGKGGKYLVGAEICFVGNANDVHLGIYVNGSHSYDSLNWWIEYGDSLQGASRSSLIDLAEGDYLELYTLTNGSTINSATTRTKLFGFRLIGA